jgi:hypothetical protein
VYRRIFRRADKSGEPKNFHREWNEPQNQIIIVSSAYGLVILGASKSSNPERTLCTYSNQLHPVDRSLAARPRWRLVQSFPAG